MPERRNTVQQNIVFQTLHKMHNHPTADTVYREVIKSYPEIGRATVFRALNRMSEEGRVLRVANDNGADSFDFNIEPHCHVRCIKCGRIDDILVKRMPEPEKNVENTCGYRITGHSLLFTGICPECDTIVSKEERQ